MEEVEQLAHLISQIREIEAAFKLIEIDEEPARVQYQVDVFREYYRKWYEDCRGLLPPDLRQRFEEYYEGHTGIPEIKNFFADIPRLRELAIKTGSARRREARYVFWQREVGTRFSAPITAQVGLLQEAIGRSVARYGSNMHPSILAASGKLLQDGHYRLAIFQGCLALNKAVKEKSGSSAPDGTALMQHAFSPRQPLLKISDDPDERLGLMWLFSGAMMGLRNPQGHHLSDDKDMSKTEAMEWLGFLSALLRQVDRAEQAPQKP